MNNPWLDIRNSSGHLLFRYNPFTNEIEFKGKGFVYEIIRLDHIRAKYGVVEISAKNSVVDMIIVPERSNSSK